MLFFYFFTLAKGLKLYDPLGFFLKLAAMGLWGGGGLFVVSKIVEKVVEIVAVAVLSGKDIPIGQGSPLQGIFSILSPGHAEMSPKQVRVLVCCPDPQVVEHGPKSDHWDQHEPASHWIPSIASPGQADGSPKQVLDRVWTPSPQVTEQGPKSDHWDQHNPASHSILSVAVPGQFDVSPKHSRVRVRRPDPQVTEQDPKSDQGDQPKEQGINPGQGRVSVPTLPSLEQYCPSPDGLGSLQNRFRVSMPDPQVAEQVDQAPHWPQFPSWFIVELQSLPKKNLKSFNVFHKIFKHYYQQILPNIYIQMAHHKIHLHSSNTECILNNRSLASLHCTNTRQDAYKFPGNNFGQSK